MPRITRRGLIAGAGAVGAGLALGGVELERALGDTPEGSGQIPFDGVHQAGIATAAQDRLHFAAFDVTSGRREDLRDVLRAWTEAARRMTAGELVGEVDVPAAPPDDTGEAIGLPPARLTVTLGFGPSLFDGRYGLAARRPAPLADLPPLPGDELDPARSGGDLCVQACADDPQVVFHAVRNLARIGRGAVVMRWSQLGFGRTSTTSRAQATPRNLMGFKDGTNNIKLEDEDALAEHVWADGPAWLRGGTYLVARRIRMLIEVWDRASFDDQEATIGRVKDRALHSARSASSTRSIWRRSESPRMRTSAWPRRRRTAGSRSCGAATRSRTAWTNGSASSTPACSSSASSAIRPPSSSCSGGSAAPTR
jgi:deferrochelatase/peroxidase EfeB